MTEVDVSDLGRLDVERYRRELAALPALTPAQCADPAVPVESRCGYFGDDFAPGTDYVDCLEPMGDGERA